MSRQPTKRNNRWKHYLIWFGSRNTRHNSVCNSPHANTTTIQTKELTLTTGNSTTLTLTWNTAGVAKGNYTITAKATPVLDETDITDNTLTDGWIVIALVGDINADGIVDITDIYLIALAFGAMPPDPNYRPNLDIIYDEIIDISDIYTAAIHFGETDL